MPTAFAKVAICSLVVVLAAIAPGFVRAQDSTASDPVALGDAAFDRLDNEEAVRMYEAARKSTNAEPGFELLARLSRTHNDLGMDRVAEGLEEEGEAELNVALDYAEQLTSRYPDRPESWFRLAAAYGNLALFKGGRDKVRIGREVEHHCRKAIRLDSTFAPPYAVLGIFYRELAELSWVQRALAQTLFGGLPPGSLESSERMLRKAIELSPALPLAHYELGLTLRARGRTEEAREHLRIAAELPPLATQDVRNASEARRLLADS